MASYKKMSTGWKVTISTRINGKLKQISKNGFATKNEARQYALKIEAEGNVETKSKDNVIFSDYFEQWYRTYKEQKLESSTSKNTCMFCMY